MSKRPVPGVHIKHTQPEKLSGRQTPPRTTNAATAIGLIKKTYNAQLNFSGNNTVAEALVAKASGRLCSEQGNWAVTGFPSGAQAIMLAASLFPNRFAKPMACVDFKPI
jgi:hypothetical protein